MGIKPGIASLSGLTLIGKKADMSFAADKTQDLWQDFMPRISAIRNRVGSEHYSVEIYKSPAFFMNFDLTAVNEKWAAIRVSDLQHVPDELESLEIQGGLYAVFPYKGKASEAYKTYQYIYGTWIPASDYELDDRPHVAVMGENYKNEAPDSEEQFWIPIREKE